MRQNNDYAGNLYRKSSLGNGGRRAGTGIVEDDYSEESGGCESGGFKDSYKWVRFPNDSVKPEELNGEVIIVQPGKRKD